MTPANTMTLHFYYYLLHFLCYIFLRKYGLTLLLFWDLFTLQSLYLNFTLYFTFGHKWGWTCSNCLWLGFMTRDDKGRFSVFLTHTQHAHTRPHPETLLFYHSLSFCSSVGRDRDRHKKDGPVSGIENGPYCFTRDLGSGGKIERKTGRGKRA